MARRITVIQGHPDPSGLHLLNILADRYAEAAQSVGHEVRRIEIAQIDFPLLRTQSEFESGAIPPALDAASRDLLWAEHLVFFFPLWLGTMPALVKAFLEQVMRPGLAFDYVAAGFPKKLLTGRSARLVITMGMPTLIYRWCFGAHGVRGLEQSILKFAGITPVRESLFGMVDSADPVRKQHWFEQMRHLGMAAK